MSSPPVCPQQGSYGRHNGWQDRRTDGVTEPPKGNLATVEHADDPATSTVLAIVHVAYLLKQTHVGTQCVGLGISELGWHEPCGSAIEVLHDCIPVHQPENVRR